jgi:hypothetical protein
MRVIWGGDDAVNAIRAVPRPPTSAELSFPDRFSFSLLDAERVATLDAAGISDLGRRLFNDAFWFDQMGCASPRLLVWRGNGTTADVASNALVGSLRQEVTRRGYRLPPGAAMAKLVHVAEAAALGRATGSTWRDQSVTTLQLRSLSDLERNAPGGGLFAETTINDIADLADLVEVKDQTLSHFGFGADELRRLARLLGARGIDRMVPIGDALSFDRYWDGRDLFMELSRSVSVKNR